MVPLQVQSISLSNVGFVAMLVTEDGLRNLPIFIGVPEAQAIALQVNRVKPPRPMTHDLLKNIFDLFECRLERVVITALEEGTFYAQLEITSGQRRLEVDSRPSDAIALALRCGVTIYAEERVLDEAGIAAEDVETATETSPPLEEQPVHTKKPATPEDAMTLLKNLLDKAVSEEHYEEAARIRDEIKKRESSN